MNNSPVTNDDGTPITNSPETLERLLTDMIRYPNRRAELIETIEETFGQKMAILVLDMSGFSRTTQRLGIVSFLMMIHQMRLICRPCVEERHGKVIKAEADNLFCLFETVEDAIHAAREMNQRLDAANRVLPVEHHLYAAFGIGYGMILNIGDEDIFGDEMNVASKLGEDIARPGEIMLTMAAQTSLKATDIRTHEEGISISGISLFYYLVED